jgi:invasion protein IalB
MQDKRIEYRVLLLLVLGVALSIGAAQAQDAAPQPKPAPAQKPAAAAKPAPAPLYSAWTKLCAPESQGATPTCLTLTEARAQNGQFLAGAGIIEQQGVEKKTLRITLPLAMLDQKGVQLTFDQDQPMVGPYLTCLPAGCLADFDATPAIVAKMQKGQSLMVKALRLDGSLLAVPLPLPGFAKANSGPPTDPKVIAEQQQKLRDQITKANPPAPAPNAAAPAAPAPGAPAPAAPAPAAPAGDQ